eukprot:COSAG06_NODE_4754_length_3981_cov_2.955458_4_plen_97_part_00
MHISSGSEALPCPLAGCQGSISRQFSSHDLYTQLSYLRYLFDHERQRDNLQRKRTCHTVPCHAMPCHVNDVRSILSVVTPPPPPLSLSLVPSLAVA